MGYARCFVALRAQASVLYAEVEDALKGGALPLHVDKSWAAHVAAKKVSFQVGPRGF